MTETAKTLFTPLQVGRLELRNRVVMAPMTRGRAEADGTPTEIMPTYYRQRAEAGLIVTEATAISPMGVGWLNAPGIYTDAHEQAWKPVTDAVHQAGGRIFLQLWHMGRVSHPDFLQGELPVGPSAIAAEGESHTPEGKKPYVTPRALAADELAAIVDDYRKAAARAVAAGFDGVEVHGANGYLLDQFIRDGSNQRDDAFGGSVDRRWRFPLDVVRAVASEVGADRTAIRLSPVGAHNGMRDSQPVESFSYGAKELSSIGLAFVHVMEARGGMMFDPEAPVVHPHLRRALGDTPMILNGGYDREDGDAAIAEGLADAIAYGVLFLANPDLVARFRDGATAFNEPDFATLYSPGEKGYTDYPPLG